MSPRVREDHAAILSAGRAAYFAILLMLGPWSNSSATIPPPGPGQPPPTDYLGGAWIVDPTCVGLKGQYPPSFSVTFKSTDPATGKRTYHVSFICGTLAQSAEIASLQKFDTDVTTSDDKYLMVEKTFPPWSVGGSGLIGKLQVEIKSWSNDPGHLHVRMFLVYPYLGTWENFAACNVYVRTP